MSNFCKALFVIASEFLENFVYHCELCESKAWRVIKGLRTKYHFERSGLASYKTQALENL